MHIPKPHLIYHGGLWFCRWYTWRGIGATPQDAYEVWRGRYVDYHEGLKRRRKYATRLKVAAGVMAASFVLYFGWAYQSFQ